MESQARSLDALSGVTPMKSCHCFASASPFGAPLSSTVCTLSTPPTNNIWNVSGDAGIVTWSAEKSTFIDGSNKYWDFIFVTKIDIATIKGIFIFIV